MEKVTYEWVKRSADGLNADVLYWASMDDLRASLSRKAGRRLDDSELAKFLAVIEDPETMIAFLFMATFFTSFDKQKGEASALKKKESAKPFRMTDVAGKIAAIEKHSADKAAHSQRSDKPGNQKFKLFND